ncbi:MAG TPA: hypothetical protein VKP30_27990, partial [Polyangiaceae bacterium]|nr:hypothetical protein [Polyangiaceae bacterium]
DRNHRFGNVAELAAKLMPFAPKRARPSVERIARIIAAAGIVASMPELPPASVAAPQSVRTDGNWGQTKARVHLARRGIAGVVITALAILGGVGIWAARPRPSASANSALSDSTITPLSSSLPSAAGAVEVFPVLGGNSDSSAPMASSSALQSARVAPRAQTPTVAMSSTSQAAGPTRLVASPTSQPASPTPAESSSHARQLATSRSAANGQPLEGLNATEQRAATPSVLPAASKKLPPEKRDLFDTPH